MLDPFQILKGGVTDFHLNIHFSVAATASLGQAKARGWEQHQVSHVGGRAEPSPVRWAEAGAEAELAL